MSLNSAEKWEDRLAAGELLPDVDALEMWESWPLDELGGLADSVRRRLHGDQVFYNRNVHFEPTNKCVYSCRFCAFYRRPDQGEADGAWEFGLDDLLAQLERHPVGTLTEVHITGGVHPERGISWAEELLRGVRRARPELHLKAFTAVELSYFARRDGLTLEQVLGRLQAAGLDSLPGGGAEILEPEVRRKIAGGKAPAHTWLEAHRAAHRLGIPSNATMLYGHVETLAHRIAHLRLLRALQSESCGFAGPAGSSAGLGGFQAFIPLRYRNMNNALSGIPEASREEDLRTFALSRLYLGNIPHLKAYWVMLGMERALEAQRFGADDLDGTIDDSTKIYSMAGGEEHPARSSAELEERIRTAGLKPVERDSLYRPLPR
jgi:aminodeoxyfutalosine synthase